MERRVTEKKEGGEEEPPSPVVTCTKWYVHDNGRSRDHLTPSKREPGVIVGNNNVICLFLLSLLPLPTPSPLPPPTPSPLSPLPTPSSPLKAIWWPGSGREATLPTLLAGYSGWFQLTGAGKHHLHLLCQHYASHHIRRRPL